MFRGSQNKKNIHAHVELLLKIIEDFVMNESYDNYNQGHTAFQYHLEVLEKVESISKALSEVIFGCVLLENNDIAEIGKHMTERLLRWLHPTQQMKNKLYSILLLEADIKFYDEMLQVEII